jgi:methylated-DNA-protein-cysteine methyltransferase-like protein
MHTYDRIYAIVRQIPPGQVATYGQVAELAGLIGKPRLVGYALYRVDMEQSDIPWQRVINAKGEVSQSPLRNGTDYLQRAILEDEGIEFDEKGRIDLSRYRWQPGEKEIAAALELLVPAEDADAYD